MRYLLFTILVFIGLHSCESDNDFIREEALKEFELKASAFKKERDLLCRGEALVEAESYVDSIIARMAIQPLAEDQYQPEIPEKPQYLPVDSSVYRPPEKIKPITEPKIE